MKILFSSIKNKLIGLDFVIIFLIAFPLLGFFSMLTLMVKYDLETKRPTQECYRSWTNVYKYNISFEDWRVLQRYKQLPTIPK